jgi:ketose-bisphosphate aldolase
MLVSTKEMLQDARRNHYAVAAINTQGGQYDIIRAIVDAAEKKKAPVILAHYESTGAYSGNEWFFENARYLANKVSVPVGIHLDHGSSFGICMEALKLGFTSIMYDASEKTIEQNIEESNEIIRIAHAFNVPVEVEIGALQRLDDGMATDVDTNIVSSKTVIGFLDKCRPDSLAIGIGNAHGFYRETPNLRLDILDDVSKHSDIPLVLHGCTGMDDNQVKEAIRKGISKINYGTLIRSKYVEFLKEGIQNLDHQDHTWKISRYASAKLTKVVEEIIELSGSEGKAYNY